jgi:hypothetical protein
MNGRVKFGLLAGMFVFQAPLVAWPQNQGVTPPADIEQRTQRNLNYFQQEGRRSGLSNLKFETEFEFPRVIVTGFSANMGTGTVSGTGRVDLFNPLGRQSMKVQYRRVPLANYVRSYLVKWDADISGTIDADLDLRWNGITRAQARRSMTGTGTVRYSGGQIRRASAITAVANEIGLRSPLPLQIQRGTAQGTMTNGTLRINQMRILGRDVAAQVTGSVNLATGVADTKFDLFVNQAMANRASKLSSEQRAARAPSWVRTARVPVPVSLSLRGDLEAPNFVVVPR